MDADVTNITDVQLSNRLEPNIEEWNYPMRRTMQEIIPGVFLGPFGSAGRLNVENLRALKVTHIVCIRQDVEARLIRPLFPEEFQYLVLTIADHPNQPIIPFIPQFKEFVDGCLNSGGRVLVHGNSGVSRSAALVAAYIMETRLCVAAEALRYVQSKRFCVFPNEGFKRQLFEYEPILRARLGSFPVTNSARVEKRKEREDEDEMLLGEKCI